MKKVTLKDSNWRCFVFGHKESEHTDYGYHYCERCPSHEYYDFERVEAFGGINLTLFTIPSMWYYMTWHLKRFRGKIYTRCSQCKRITSFFGKPRDDYWERHKDCLPF